MTLLIEDQSVLFVDDNPQLREANLQSLELAGIATEAFADAASALKRIDEAFTGIVVSDIRMPGMDGLELFARIRERDAEIPVILITGHADVPMAIGALRDGAFEFLTKPFAAEHLVAAVRKALETRRLVIENRRLRAAADGGDSPLIGDSAAMARLRQTIDTLARADVDVLVEGETGTGKELVAVLLHRRGKRRGRPFVAVNCGALPEELAEAELFGHEAGAVAHGRLERKGRIESASGGTLFLDEIDSMALTVQAKLLRVLEEREVLPLGGAAPRPVDLRVVAAAKGDLMRMVEQRQFREDLYYRLNVVRLRLPPLRERRADIPQLFAHFTAEAMAQTGQGEFAMTDAMRRRLVEHDWPGNVRELRNYAFRAMLGLDSDSVTPDRSAAALSLAERVERFEGAVLVEALEACQGDIRSTMALLSIPRKTLYDKMNRHGIDPARFRGDG
ncbi:MAG: sigma-54-dependent transcriptional regulator [Pseudomonadota bacterium]